WVVKEDPALEGLTAIDVKNELADAALNDDWTCATSKLAPFCSMFARATSLVKGCSKACAWRAPEGTCAPPRAYGGWDTSTCPKQYECLGAVSGGGTTGASICVSGTPTCGSSAEYADDCTDA